MTIQVYHCLVYMSSQEKEISRRALNTKKIVLGTFWAVMGVGALALTVINLIRKKSSMYGANTWSRRFICGHSYAR